MVDCRKTLYLRREDGSTFPLLFWRVSLDNDWRVPGVIPYLRLTPARTERPDVAAVWAFILSPTQLLTVNH